MILLGCEFCVLLCHGHDVSPSRYVEEGTHSSFGWVYVSTSLLTTALEISFDGLHPDYHFSARPRVNCLKGPLFSSLAVGRAQLEGS